jgi:nitroreductase
MEGTPIYLFALWVEVWTCSVLGLVAQIFGSGPVSGLLHNDINKTFSIDFGLSRVVIVFMRRKSYFIVALILYY